MDAFSFRALRHPDLPLVYVWFSAPHARRWFKAQGNEAEVAAEYAQYVDGQVPIYAYVVMHGEVAVGLMNWERLGDFPELMALYGVTDPDTANCDVIIGNVDYAHRRLGPDLIRRFVSEIIFADARITGVVIDPHRANKIAIRAYEKAGFTFVRDAVDEDGAELHLMDLKRPTP